MSLNCHESNKQFSIAWGRPVTDGRAYDIPVTGAMKTVIESPRADYTIRYDRIQYEMLF